MSRQDNSEKRRKAQQSTGGTADTDPQYADIFDYSDKGSGMNATLYKSFANKSALAEENNLLQKPDVTTASQERRDVEPTSSPYEELFRRAEERREQRRREAEALRPQESAQEIEARHEKLRKAAAISDAVAAIGNMLWVGRGSRPVYDPRQSMSEAARKRYAEAMARHDKQQQAWLRAREAYERGENNLESLRLRAMDYEDRRKAREADQARRDRKLERDLAASEAKERRDEQRAKDQHNKDVLYGDYISARTDAAHATAGSTRARAAAQVRNVNNQIENRNSRTQQLNEESEDRIRKRKDNSGTGSGKGGGSVLGTMYNVAHSGLRTAAQNATNGFVKPSKPSAKNQGGKGKGRGQGRKLY